MDLKSLEGKTLIMLSTDERKAIASAYLAYFDKLEPRERLLGYCVVYAGISSVQVGLIDVGFRAKAGTDGLKQLEYSLFLDGNEILLLDNMIENMLFEYISTDVRFMQYMNNDDFKFPADWLKIPLFAPKVHGKSERLHDCRTFLAKAGKAIGFSARHIVLHKLCGTIYFKTPFIMRPPLLHTMTEKKRQLT